MRSRLLPLLGLALLALAQPAARAADKLPDDVDIIPSDSALILSVRVADLYDSEAGKALRKNDPKAFADLNKELREGVGCDVELVERITFCATDVGGNEPILIVSTR